MCGIAGFCNSRIDRPALIRAMTDRMRHRGPDAEGFWFDDQSGWTLGHRRLSILDLSAAGSQPMVSASGRYVLSYNGEIYNASELRDMLLNGGYVYEFRGHSDTEILLEAIEAWGLEETLTLSKGMFALAVYDRQEKVLQLARDRAGEKPLYYGMAHDEFGKPFFTFASDLALFLCVPGFHPEIDRDALAAFLMYKYVPAPASIYKGIFKLPAGCTLTLRAPFKAWDIKAYWSLADTALNGQKYPFSGSDEEAKNIKEYLLRNRVNELKEKET